MEDFVDFKEYSGVIEGQRIRLGSAIIRDGAQLRGCTIEVVDGRFAFVFAVEFENCEIISKKSVRRFSWGKAKLTNCKFTGVLYCHDFGSGPESDKQGTVDSCDFTQAVLFGCRFFNVALESNAFAGWPTVVAVPRKDAPVGLLRAWFMQCERLSFYVYEAAMVAREARVDLEPIRQLESRRSPPPDRETAPAALRQTPRNKKKGP